MEEPCKVEMRTFLLLAIALLILSPSPRLYLAFDANLLIREMGEVERYLTPDEVGYTLSPESDSWTNEKRPGVGIKFLGMSPEIDVRDSVFVIDGLHMRPKWDWASGTLSVSPSSDLDEGPHFVSVYIPFEDGSYINATWTFNVDTVSPVLLLSPVPDSVQERTLTVTGEVAERNLATVSVNGNLVSVDSQNRFEVVVVLWPGSNDIEAIAVDYAGNSATIIRSIAWEPRATGALTLEEYTHHNSSFVIGLPADWIVYVDPLLEGGGRADIVALGPGDGNIQPSISVVSGASSPSLSDEEALAFVNGGIENLTLYGEMVVIGRPRIVSRPSNALEAQFTILQKTGEGAETFLFGKYVWSSVLRRNWVILATGGSEEAPRLWPTFAASVGSFRFLETGQPGSLFSSLRDVILIVSPFATAASIFIVAFFSYVLYKRRRRET